MFLIMSLLMVACSSPEPVEPVANQASSAKAIRVEAITLEASDAVIELELPGEVEGSRDARLAAANGGFVEKVLVSTGQKVSAGTTLAQIDGGMFKAQKDQADASVTQAEAGLRRIKAMGDLAPKSQLEDAELGLLTAKAGQRQAANRLSRAYVKAPFAGTIGGVGIEPGEAVAPGTQVIRLVQMDPAKVVLSVSDRDVTTLKEGMKVQVTTAAQSQMRTGEIVGIAPAAHPSTRAFPVEVYVDNPDESLRPGMVASVTLKRKLTGANVVIPQDWLVTRRDERGVFLVEDGRALWRSVTLGDVVHDKVVVTSGLKPGAVVVVTGHRGLVDGDEVLISRQGSCCAAGRPVW